MCRRSVEVLDDDDLMVAMLFLEGYALIPDKQSSHSGVTRSPLLSREKRGDQVN